MEKKLYTNNVREWLVIYQSYCKGALVKHLLTTFISAKNICQADNHQLLAAGVTPTQLQALKNPDQQQIDTFFLWGQTPGQHILTWDHPAYPPLLKNIYDPPLILFVKGKIETLMAPQIAVVGSRNPSHSGKETAFLLAHDLTTAGITVTSGLALGIDGAAHSGALRAKGSTVAVLGSGLECVYPLKHISLAEEIIEHGVLVSEFPPFAPPMAQNFPQRNRIISGLSMGACVVEAAMASGSLITAKFAADQGREVFAVPGSLQNPWAKGCNQLIQQGAKLVMDASDILNELHHFEPFAKIVGIIAEPSKPAPLDSAMKQLLECVDDEVTTVDQLQMRIQKPVAEIMALITDLELQGWISPAAGGYIKRR